MNTVEYEIKYHPTKEVCARLDIADSTLRKWCIALEKNGYNFTRTTQNRRLYTNHDLKVLDHLKELIQGKGMNLENASIIVISKFTDMRSSEGTPSVPDKNDEPPVQRIVEKLQEHIEKQERFNQELVKRLDEQNQYIKERLDQRDKLLMETMDDLIEQRKEEMKLLEEANKKKENWFTKLFKK